MVCIPINGFIYNGLYLGKVLRLFWIKFYILTIFRPDKILGCFQVVNNSQFEIA